MSSSYYCFGCLAALPSTASHSAFLCVPLDSIQFCYTGNTSLWFLHVFHSSITHLFYITDYCSSAWVDLTGCSSARGYHSCLGVLAIGLCVDTSCEYPAFLGVDMSCEYPAVFAMSCYAELSHFCLFVFLCECMHVKVKGQPLVPSSIALHLAFRDRFLSRLN